MSNWEVVKDDSAGIHVINICTDLYKIHISNYQMLHPHPHEHPHVYIHKHGSIQTGSDREKRGERENKLLITIPLTHQEVCTV